MRIRNVGLEGQIEGAFPDAGFGDLGSLSFGGETGNGEEAASGGGGKLSPPAGSNGGSSDSRNGDVETPKKRRGRPPGIANAAKSSGKLTADKLADARRKFISTLAGGISFGFSFYGVQRGKKYSQYSPDLAQRVYQCYLVPPDAAEGVAEPIADTFIQHFPQYVEPVEKGINPALAVARVISLLQQTSDNEKRVVQRFQQEIRPPQAPTNGHQPPEPEQPTESPLDQWMSEQGQSTEEILTENVPVS